MIEKFNKKQYRSLKIESPDFASQPNRSSDEDLAQFLLVESNPQYKFILPNDFKHSMYTPRSSIDDPMLCSSELKLENEALMYDNFLKDFDKL